MAMESRHWISRIGHEYAEPLATSAGVITYAFKGQTGLLKAVGSKRCIKIAGGHTQLSQMPLDTENRVETCVDGIRRMLWLQPGSKLFAPQRDSPPKITFLPVYYRGSGP
ncbi:hypothetical protein OCUBac02_08180 [Bosea sp. ANAM02]|nr:hypothetical protein OCUBac02_08180 [Bosea sp. ANAM02]